MLRKDSLRFSSPGFSNKYFSAQKLVFFFFPVDKDFSLKKKKANLSFSKVE